MILKVSNFDNKYMGIALAEAEIAYENGEVPVGCVIVDRNNGEVIAQTHNLIQLKKNPNLHAEMLAIDAACNKKNSKNLSDCSIYTTLEPCAMCASAISNSRISRLYYGASDVKQGAVENGIRLYANTSCIHRPEIYCGINIHESNKIIKKFFCELRKN